MTALPLPLTRARLPLRSALTDAWVLVGRCVRLTRRDVDSLVMAIVLPLVLMALFVYVFGGAITTGTDYVDYVVPGIVLLCTGYGAAATAMAVAADMAGGMTDRLRSLPIAGWSVLAGHVVASAVRNALSTVVVVGAAVAMGFRPDATAVEWLATAGLLLLYVLALSWLAAGLGALASSTEAASGLSFVMLFVPYLSSAFVPTGSMPAPLRAVAEHQPVTPVIETVRGLLTGTPVGGSGWQAVAWCTGLLAVTTTFAAWAYRRRTAR